VCHSPVTCSSRRREEEERKHIVNTNGKELLNKCYLKMSYSQYKKYILIPPILNSGKVERKKREMT